MRKRKTAEAAEVVQCKAVKVLEARAALGSMYKPTETKKARSTKARGVSKREADRFVREVDEYLNEGSVSNMSPRHWVALFCWTHEAIYEVSCIEEVRGEWNVASAAASRMLNEEFDGKESEFLAYLQWAAKREEERELWRRSNRRDGQRLHWRHFFLFKSLLGDYRLAKARAEGPK